MPRKKTTTTLPTSSASTDELLALLPAERRAAILEEVVGTHFRAAVEGAGSLGSLVDTLKGHAHWSIFQKLPVSSLLQIGGSKTAAHRAPSAAPAAAAKAPAATAARPAAAKPAAKAKPKKFVRRSSEDIARNVEKVLGFITKNPGLRTEAIMKQVGGDAKGIKDALARLRDEKKVKTTGIKRAMTYQIA